MEALVRERERPRMEVLRGDARGEVGGYEVEVGEPGARSCCWWKERREGERCELERSEGERPRAN